MAPEPSPVGPATQCLDAGMGRRSQLCPGPDAVPGQWRGDSSGPEAVRGALEAGQTLDHQPRSRLPQKKKRRDRVMRLAAEHPTWALGLADAVWWSRLAQPDPHGWTEPEATPKLQELSPPTHAPDPNALACDGLLGRPGPAPAGHLGRRLVTGRPVSAVTIALLAWCSARLAAQGFTALLFVWDNASWHRRQAVRRWLRPHHQQVKRGAKGVRLIVCHLPSQSPWLNPIAPTWIHGKRAVSAPDRLLNADEREARVYAYDGSESETHLVMPKTVA